MHVIGSRVPQKSLIWIHATSKPDAARAGLQGSAQTYPRGHYSFPRTLTLEQVCWSNAYHPVNYTYTIDNNAIRITAEAAGTYRT